MKTENFDISSMPEDTSYERMNKQLLKRLAGKFTIAWNSHNVASYSECVIINEILIAVLLILPEDVTFSEYIEKKGYLISAKRTLYYFLCHEHSCYCVQEKQELKWDDLYNLVEGASVVYKKYSDDIKKDVSKVLSECFDVSESDFDKYMKLNGFEYEFTSDFFNLVFGKIDSVQTICRYTSLQSFFLMINNKCVRMCALPGMNDPSESAFAYNYIHEIPPEKRVTTNKRRKKVLNETLILSFCEGKDKLDDLTQWRLYGDDAKGVCCEYELNGVLPNDFIFRRTIYDDASPQGVLEKIKKIYHTIDKRHDCFYVNYRQIYPFFKSAAYSVEQEIRLLYNIYDNSKIKWLLTNDHSIVNAYTDIPLNEFPLKLKKVILGSKMDGKETNLYQIKRMLESIASKDKKLDYLRDVKIELSSIECYR